VTERTTESRNPRATKLGTMTTREILELLNDEDATVPAAVRKALPQIERAVDVVVKALAAGGRLRYVGAGTSGRLGVLDASEMPPTFGVDPALVHGVIAGGDHALRMSVEGAEDQAWAAARDLADQVRAGDVVVGISASGRAPYVLAALEAAKRDLGAAATIGITCNPASRLAREPDVPIAVDVGPEVVAGSSRMKAGTATKLVLNTLTTASMTRLGRVYGNRMIDVQPRSRKLRERAIRLVAELGRVPTPRARRALAASDGSVRAAIVIARTSCSPGTAARALRQSGGSLDAALAALREIRGASPRRRSRPSPAR